MRLKFKASDYIHVSTCYGDEASVFIRIKKIRYMYFPERFYISITRKVILSLLTMILTDRSQIRGHLLSTLHNSREPEG